MLTFEALRKIVSDEKAAPKLTGLPERFLEEAALYLEKKVQMRENQEDAWELESARQLLKDLLEIRERKLVNLALYYTRSGIVPDRMTPEEERFFRAVASVLADFQKERDQLVKKQQDKRTVLAFLEDVPAFVGTDLQTYGPFKQGDVATVPEPVGRLLIEKGAGKKIEVGE